MTRRPACGQGCAGPPLSLRCESRTIRRPARVLRFIACVDWQPGDAARPGPAGTEECHGLGKPQDHPYCGLPPLPDAIWSRWNLDPILIGALLLVAGLYGLGAGRQAAFYLGWGLAAAALISPLCALSVSLFAARVGQHMILTLLAAPLVAAGRPGLALAALLGAERRAEARRGFAPFSAAGLFAVLLWIWHAPGPYAATFAGSFAYWLMHLSLFGAALWLWHNLLDTCAAKALAVMGASLASTVQMGLLGAIITFAPRPVYAPHAHSTLAWGLTSLQDQQLGGAIMWAPGCLAFLVVAMLVLRVVLTEAERSEWEAPARPMRIGQP